MNIHRANSSVVRWPGRAGGLVSLLAAASVVSLGGWIAPADAQQQERHRAGAGQEQQTYEVDRGDTLWDLAREFLSDPFEWDRIYELNREKIDDPHWIFPGQRFRIPGREAGARAAAGRRNGDGQGDPFDAPSIFDHNPERGVRVGDLKLNERRDPALVSASDFYKSSFVSDREALGPHGATARLIRENPLGLEIPPSVRLRDRVVLHLGGLEVEDGDTLQAVRRGRTLDDVRIVKPLGLLEIDRVRGDSARAVVISVYGDYREGDPVIPVETYTEGDRRSLQRSGRRLQGRVLGMEVEQALVSTGDHIYLDRGAADGVTVGDEFAVFPSAVEDPTAAPVEDRLGVVRVVRVRENTATARVVETRDIGIRAGLSVLRVREPVIAGG